MDTFENSVIFEVKELMIFDDYQNIDEVLDLIKKILNTRDYFEIIKNDFDKILEDKKIDSNDITKMMIVMIKLKNLLPKILNLKEKVSKITYDKMKYIFYATLYLYIIKYQPDFFDQLKINEFSLLYSNLWSLVEINPENINITKKKISGFFCCGNIDEREEQNENETQNNVVVASKKKVKFDVLPNNEE